MPASEMRQICGASALRLHPSGARVYPAKVGSSPDDAFRLATDNTTKNEPVQSFLHVVR